MNIGPTTITVHKYKWIAPATDPEDYVEVWIGELQGGYGILIKIHAQMKDGSWSEFRVTRLVLAP